MSIRGDRAYFQEKFVVVGIRDARAGYRRGVGFRMTGI
jgi:hypothetical protein